jgi:hypothetical protein
LIRVFVLRLGFALAATRKPAARVDLPTATGRPAEGFFVFVFVFVFDYFYCQITANAHRNTFKSDLASVGRPPLFEAASAPIV